ncbi:hypothetical protein MAR_028333 [Mya arenaria]|uniref:Uncharacterized protein n=1 Tax=Mya arenaria TaxID=6604 RepID=A0ABY7DEC9_MYAAR|nr:hypothetical protein MAR_028333 [Mya arenaria]
MVSSYENVYTGVPLEPTVNRMSMDVSEMDIGDKFDTKQSDNKLAAGLSSSYEKLYEKAAGDDEDAEGECKSESALMSSASAVVDVRSSIASVVHTSQPVTTNHSSPIYITVESGLDKLACSSSEIDSQQYADLSLSPHAGHSSRVRGDLVERSASCDSAELLDEGYRNMVRPVSSPDVTFRPVDQQHHDEFETAAHVLTKQDQRKPIPDIDEHFPVQQTTFDRNKTLDLEKKTSVEEDNNYTVTESPRESVSPSSEPADISPVHEDLKVNEMAISVGRSPSDFHFEPEEFKEQSVEKMKRSLAAFSQDSGDSLFDEERRIGHLSQVEKIVSKETHHEKKSSTVSSSVEQKTVFKEFVGETPKIVMEEKVFSTEDTENYSKTTESADEMTLTTSEVIKEDIEVLDDGSEIKKEKKELVATIDKDSNLKTDESNIKSLSKKEETKEITYPFKSKGEEKEKLVDIVATREETLATALHTMTDSGQKMKDETRLKLERTVALEGDTEKIVGAEIQTEEHQHIQNDQTKEKGTSDVIYSRKDQVTEVLFDVETKPSQTPEIVPTSERYGEQVEIIKDTQTFESDTERKEDVTFFIDKNDTQDHTKMSSEIKSQRDSGLFEETFSEESDDNEMAIDQTKVGGYDNMAFTAEDVVRPKDNYRANTYSDTGSKLAKHGDISPEDLEERLNRFDFAEELKEELGREIIDHKDDDRTLSLSDFDTRRDQSVLTPLGVEDIPVDETEKQPTACGGVVDLDLEGTEELEGAVGPAMSIDDQQIQQILDTSSSSSSLSENEVFDTATGRYVPWEIRSQFSRQFSDSFLEQQKDLEKSHSTKSLDMGMFYRRDVEKDENIDFNQKPKDSKSSESSDEVSPSIKKKVQRVRFSLSEDHSEMLQTEAAIHSYDVKISEEWEKSARKEKRRSDSIESDETEPHEKITEAYQKAVIASIIESRILIEQERQKEIEELENLEESTAELIPETKVKVTHADTVVYTSTGIDAVSQSFEEDEDVEEEEYEHDEDNEVEMVNTMIQTVVSQPLTVVSRESRKAHEELLKESFDEKDRSISPSIDSEDLSTTYENQSELREELDVSALSRKFPVSVLVQGKPTSETETYVSFETDRDTNEDERLSPIEETSGDEIIEHKGEKKVTFQTQTQHLGSASSEDLVKTSTSSSEVEPTLLSASYDLDSGKVSHVVTSYDLSPDAVEKQFLPVKAPKAILSSPEDDVFEADVTIEEKTESVVPNEATPTDGDIELLPKDSPEEKAMSKSVESASTGTSSIPSPPAPSPFERNQRLDHITSDLQVAAFKMRALRKSDGDSFESGDLNLDLPQSNVEIEVSDDDMSPFEVMTHSDLEGYDGYVDKRKEIEKLENVEREEHHVVPSAPPLSDLLSPDKSQAESSFDHSSPVSSEPSEKGMESPFELPPSSPEIVELAPHSTEQNVEEDIMPNGPTEVDYNPEIDLDFSGPSYQPQQQEQEVVVVVSCQSTSQLATSQTLTSTISTTATGQSVLTESLIEELPVQSYQDVLMVSDQTLYGLEMPSDEAASMTTSHVECESMNVSLVASASAQDDTSGQIDSKEVFSQVIGFDRTEEDLSERPSESLQDIPTSVTEESHDTMEAETLMEQESISTVPLEVAQTAPELDLTQMAQGQVHPLEETGLDSEVKKPDVDLDIDSIEQYGEGATLKGYEVTVEDIEEVDLERRTPETFLEDEDDEELEQLKGTPDIDIDVKLDTEEERSKIENVEECARFELKADSCDLDRPLTPTPVDKNQGFFSDRFTPDEAAVYDKDFRLEQTQSQDKMLEKTASEFVESVLEEVKVKVKYKTALDIDDDVALVQSPLSENGGDITDFAEELPYDEDESEPLPDDSVEAEAEILHSIDRSEEFLCEDNLSNLRKTRQTKPVVLVKQVSEDVPEITLTQHLHSDEDSDEDIKPKEDHTEQEEVKEEITQASASWAEAVVPVKDSVDSAVICVPEEADEENQPVTEKIEPVSASVQRAVKPMGSDHIDSGKVCIPEEEDMEQEMIKSESVQLTALEQTSTEEKDTSLSEHVVSAEYQETFSSSTHTSSYVSVEETRENISIESHEESEQNHFLGKGSDSGTFSGKFDVSKTKLASSFSAQLVSEKELKSERSLSTVKTKDESINKLEKTVSSTSIPIPIKKSLSASSGESFDDDKSAEGAKSAEFEDAGDSSSLDSFTTVVAADEEQDDEDRMADFASLTSSIHSDVQGGGQADDEEFVEARDPIQELMAWAQDKKTKETFQLKQDIKEEEILADIGKPVEMFPWEKEKGIMPHPWRKDELEEDTDSLGGSDRFDYIDRQALSVITELSEEDRFEIINKEDIESESTGTGSDSRHYSSPDFPPPSPMSNLKFFNKSAEKDDISVSSSLLEFERLEREINQSRSSGSIETSGSGGKDSLGGSLDETKFLSKSLEKDDVSISSSLADFERLEKEVAHGSSDSSIEKIVSPKVISPPEIGKASEKSSVSGSLSSLTEFERLEKEVLSDEYRRSSMSVASSLSHISITSVTSSHSSLNEFERLEQDFNIAEELEREAQKIVSILEAGTLLPSQYSSEPDISYSESLITAREVLMTKPKDRDIDRDSIDGKDEIDEDSLSENKKKVRGDAVDDTDSLDGDKSEMTSSITSAILKSESATRLGTDFEGDSLHDSTHSSDGAMKISSDSLGEKLGTMKEEKDKFDTDSLTGQEGVMEKSADSGDLKEGILEKSTDSLEFKENMKKSSDSSELMESGIMLKSSDSLEMKDQTMEKSTDSLEDEKEKEKYETDSLQGDNDAMEASVDSLESFQIIPKHNVMEVSMDSAGTGWSSASSMFSRSSIDTMKSAEREELIEAEQVPDIMAASMESWEEYEEEEETDNYYIISKYQASLKEAAEMSKHSKTEKTEYTHPYLDFEGNVAADNYQFMMTAAEWNQNFGQNEANNSPYLSRQPYEEKKKFYTMAEWEAMKKARKQQAEETEHVQETLSSEQTFKRKDEEKSSAESDKSPSSSSIEGETDSNNSSVIISAKRSQTIEMKSSETVVHSRKTIKSDSGAKGLTIIKQSKEHLPRMLSIDDDDGTTEFDPHEHAESLRHGIPDHFAQKKGPVFIDPQYGDSEEDEILDYHVEDEEVEGAEGGDTQSTRITMKKEIHTKTVLKDGEEQTFVHEDKHVEQDPNAPEELRDSMQQIIDEFMGSPTGSQKPLEHDL